MSGALARWPGSDIADTRRPGQRARRALHEEPEVAPRDRATDVFAGASSLRPRHL